AAVRNPAPGALRRAVARPAGQALAGEVGAVPLTRSEIEQLAEQVLFLLVPVVVRIPLVVAGLLVTRLLVTWLFKRRRARGLRWRRHRGARAFDQHVQLAAIQPDAAALRAVVDLDALAVGHGQLDVGADGTIHL